jgi:Uma2 family endonuclease
MTADEYLSLERSLETRNEFWDGEVIDASSRGARDNTIAINIGCSLHQQLRKTPYKVLFHSMRIRTPDRRFFLYPDVLVAAQPEFEDAETDTLLNPILIVHGIPPATEDRDRGLRAALFRTIPSVAEIVLVLQKRRYIEHWLRQAKDRWLVVEITDPEQSLEFPSIGRRIDFSEIYEGARC